MLRYPIHGRRWWLTATMALLLSTPCSAVADGEGARGKELVASALRNWRGETSHSTMEMVIHRPDWERRMRMKVWTSGDDNSLVRVLEPSKSAGSGTLLKQGRMWTYSPKVNRVIKIPASMMSQKWMGSDFSNNEIARSDSIVEDYSHAVIGQRSADGHTIYRIELVPHEHAPVVWGRLVLDVRDDDILMRQAFYDQTDELVKVMETRETAHLDDRLVAVRQRMTRPGEPQRWTEVLVTEAEYNGDIPSLRFSVASLRNPRM